jgi:hypothetical protein
MNWRKMLFVALVGWAIPELSQGQEPGWSGQVIAFGATRAEIRSTDILHRPYRPLHFYGNSVRRRYYHGSAVPGAGLFNR